MRNKIITLRTRFWHRVLELAKRRHAVAFEAWVGTLPLLGAPMPEGEDKMSMTEKVLDGDIDGGGIESDSALDESVSVALTTIQQIKNGKSYS